jgi:GNAT superfamily N-acetyltransferase
MPRESGVTPNNTIHASVRPLRLDDVPAADRVVRLAFGTFLGLPDPASAMGDTDYVRTRWLANPSAAFVAEAQGQIVGSNFATNWGSVGFFGPLTIRPDLWDRGLGSRLMEPVMECFERWGSTSAGLFTFAQRLKHVGLYQTFGFWPRFLTAIMHKPVQSSAARAAFTRLSQVPEPERPTVLSACRELTSSIFEGLDVSVDIRAVCEQQLGDTLLLREDGKDDGRPVGLAVCHCGPRTEAGSGTCYVKFAAVRPGPTAPTDFRRLLAACDALAAERQLSTLVGGANMARHEGYQCMLERGFRPVRLGVAMHRPNDPGYNRPGVYVIDDWR